VVSTWGPAASWVIILVCRRLSLAPQHTILIRTPTLRDGALAALPLPPPIDPDPALLLAEAARDLRWSEGGRGVAVALHGLRGLTASSFSAGGGTGALAWTASVAAALQVAPRCARFERTCPAGSFLETIWVPDRLPGWVVELRPTGSWREGSGGGGSPALTGVLTLPIDTPGEKIEWDAEEGAITLRFGDREITLLATGMDPSAALLDGEGPETGDGELRIPIRMTPSDPDGRMVLAVLGGAPDSARLRSLMALAAHRGRAKLSPEVAQLQSGVEEVDEGVAWSLTRLRDHLRDTQQGPTLSPTPERPEAFVRATLACGLTSVARAALVDSPEAPDEIRGWLAWIDGHGPDPDFLDLRGVIAVDGLAPDLRERLAEAATSAGDPGWAEEIRKAPRASGVTRGGSMALPTLGTNPETRDSGRAGSESDSESEVLRWRASLADTPGSFAEPLPRVLGLLDHLLGFRADAPAGRIHLTPTLPPHWTRLAVRGLACAATRFDLEYERTEGEGLRTDRWILRPTEGAVPSTLILRLPTVHADPEVRIDGEPAQLEIERRGGLYRLPVQLPLDGERRIEILVPAPKG